jgi:hypothetical protein
MPDDRSACRVGAEFTRMCEHLVKGIPACPLAQFRIKRNVSAEQTLDVRAYVSHNRARAHNNPAHNAVGFDDPIARKFKRGRR